jgi:hypothetical protein
VWSVVADVAGTDPSQPIVVALISALGGVIVAAFGALVTLARRDSNRDEPAAPNVPPIGERTAVLERRASDSEERDDMQDRWLKHIDTRVERIERRLNHDDEEWRKP